MVRTFVSSHAIGLYTSYNWPAVTEHIQMPTISTEGGVWNSRQWNCNHLFKKSLFAN